MAVSGGVNAVKLPIKLYNIKNVFASNLFITNLFITQAFIKHTPEHFVSQLTRGHTGILCEPSSLFLWERAVELKGGRGVECDKQSW